MLDAILHSAKKFKQGMRVLESVYSRCCVQLRPDGLVFGVKNEDEGVPALLTLTERSFRTYLLTEPDFRNAYFDFDLRAFNKILDLYADNHSIAFHIVDDDLQTLRFSYVHHGDFEVRLPIYQIECPYFKTIEFNGVRPVQLILNSRLFERTLQYSLNNQQPITIIEWRSIVMTMCSEDGILQRKYADPETNEVENYSYFRFHLSLHEAPYFLLAAIYANWVFLRVASPASDQPYVPPTMTFLLEHFMYLTFLLAFDSVVQFRAYAGQPY